MQTQLIRTPTFQRPSGRLHLASNQLNLPGNGLITLVDFDTISTGYTDGIEDLTFRKITPGRAGYYNIKGQVRFTNVVADISYGALIKVGPTVTASRRRVHSSIAEDLTFDVSIINYPLFATDYLRLFAFSYAIVDTVDILAGAYDTFLEVQRVR